MRQETQDLLLSLYAEVKRDEVFAMSDGKARRVRYVGYNQLEANDCPMVITGVAGPPIKGFLWWKKP